MGADAGNAIGRSLNVLNSLIALKNGQFTNLQAAQAAALNNPAVRAGLVGHPFQAGGLGVSGAPQAVDIAPGGPSAPEQVWTPNLPPLDPTTALKQNTASAIGALQQSNPALFAAHGGFASPIQAQQVIGTANQQPDVANTVLSPGGVTYAAQPIPWNLLYRADESQSQGGPGFQGVGIGPGSFRSPSMGMAPLPVAAPSAAAPRAAAPHAVAPGPGEQWRRSLDPQQLIQLGIDPNTGQPLQTAPPAPAPAVAPPAAPTTAPQPATLPEGFTPFDPAKLGQAPIAAPASATPPAAPAAPGAPAEQANIGFPSPMIAPGGTPTPGPRTAGPPRLITSESTTTPYGAFGSQTRTTKQIDPEAEYQDSLRKQAAKGISDPLATRVDVLTIADNAFAQLLREFAPNGNYRPMESQVGPGVYNLKKFASRLPYVEAAAQGIRGLTGQGESTQNSGRFRALIEGLGIPARTFAGAAFTDTEKQLYGPTFIPNASLPMNEFRQYLTNYGRAIRDLSKTTLANYPALAPETQARLAEIVQHYESW